MKISLIIPTYNRASLIENTLLSALNQTTKIDEIIIIDDGSTDNTQELLKKYDIKYTYQENQGVSSARNKGINEAKNEWICFLDSDDIWESNKIEKQIAFHKANPHILFSHTDELWRFNDKIIKQKKHQLKPSGYCFKQNIPNTLIGASTVMCHSSVFDDVGLFDEELKACEDYDLWLRILDRYELGLIDEKLITKIAGHSGQLSFETPLMDSYRIKALLKHLNSNYKEEIKQEIIKRCDILITGAMKHQNKDVEQYYNNLKVNIK
jgi:glycosyltransferase involved in cell wall biosynthesis